MVMRLHFEDVTVRAFCLGQIACLMVTYCLPNERTERLRSCGLRAFDHSVLSPILGRLRSSAQWSLFQQDGIGSSRGNAQRHGGSRVVNVAGRAGSGR